MHILFHGQSIYSLCEVEECFLFYKLGIQACTGLHDQASAYVFDNVCFLAISVSDQELLSA